MRLIYHRYKPTFLSSEIKVFKGVNTTLLKCNKNHPKQIELSRRRSDFFLSRIYCKIYWCIKGISRFSVDEEMLSQSAYQITYSLKSTVYCSTVASPKRAQYF